MTKRYLVWLRETPPFVCELGCGRAMLTKAISSETKGWEWFTGYGDGPLHFCPACRLTRQFIIDQVRRRLNEKPVGYPDNRHVGADVLRTALMVDEVPAA